MSTFSLRDSLAFIYLDVVVVSSDMSVSLKSTVIFSIGSPSFESSSFDVAGVPFLCDHCALSDDTPYVDVIFRHFLSDVHFFTLRLNFDCGLEDDHLVFFFRHFFRRILMRPGG